MRWRPPEVGQTNVQNFGPFEGFALKTRMQGIDRIHMARRTFRAA